MLSRVNIEIVIGYPFSSHVGLNTVLCHNNTRKCGNTVAPWTRLLQSPSHPIKVDWSSAAYFSQEGSPSGQENDCFKDPDTFSYWTCA